MQKLTEKEMETIIMVLYNRANVYENEIKRHPTSTEQNKTREGVAKYYKGIADKIARAKLEGDKEIRLE